MPFTNGRFYMNPAYGRALERAREADSQRERTSNPHKPQEQGQDAHWVTIDGRHVLIGEAPAGPAQQHRPHPQRHAQSHRPAVRESDTQIANRVYHETSGLRPTTLHGSGSSDDLSDARRRLAAVIVHGNAMGNPAITGANQLSGQEQRAIRLYPPAQAAHEDSLDAAKAGLANGPQPSAGANFYLDYGQRTPPWAAGKTPRAVYGPFLNAAGGGDVPRGTRGWIKVY